MKLAPSVLSADFANLLNSCKKVENAGCEYLHLDVMDGHFVPNISFGPDLLSGIRKMTDLYIDVHFMLSEPRKYAKKYVAAGADGITFHTEAFHNDLDEITACLDYIHSLDCDAGIVVKPATDIKKFEPVFKDCDLILIMSVEPGFGGQPFMAEQLEKVQYLYQIREAKGYQYRIEIDGGITDKTKDVCIKAGVDTLVAGSYVFNGNVEERVASLLK